MRQCPVFCFYGRGHRSIHNSLIFFLSLLLITKSSKINLGKWNLFKQYIGGTFWKYWINFQTIHSFNCFIYSVLSVASIDPALTDELSKVNEWKSVLLLRCIRANIFLILVIVIFQSKDFIRRVMITVFLNFLEKLFWKTKPSQNFPLI